jgi:hypothetical protein
VVARFFERGWPGRRTAIALVSLRLALQLVMARALVVGIAAVRDAG